MPSQGNRWAADIADDLQLDGQGDIAMPTEVFARWAERLKRDAPRDSNPKVYDELAALALAAHNKGSQVGASQLLALALLGVPPQRTAGGDGVESTAARERGETLTGQKRSGTLGGIDHPQARGAGLRRKN